MKRVLQTTALVIAAIFSSVAGCAATQNAPNSELARPDITPETGSASRSASLSQPRGVRRYRPARREVERLGERGDCPDDAREDIEYAWLVAWCGHRTERPQLARRNAQIAARFFEDVADFRRAAEMWLLASLSAVALGEHLDGIDDLRRAEDLIRWGRLGLSGDLRDPYAADLAYLEGLLQLRGFRVERPNPLSSAALLRRAADEARSVNAPETRAHALRALAIAELDSGRVGSALEALSIAITSDERIGNTNGHEASFAVAAVVGQRLGVPEIAEWLAGTGLELDDEILPGRPDFSDGMRLRTTDAGRRLLAQKIEAYRVSAELRLRPDEGLLNLLLDPETLHYTRGRTWRFALQAGLLLRDAGDRETSRKYLESAVETVERTRASIASVSLRQSFFRGKRIAYASLVEHYVGIDTGNRPRSDVAAALGVANATKARGLLDLLDGTIAPEQTVDIAARWERSSSVAGRVETLQSRLRSWIGRRGDERSPIIRPFDRLHEVQPGRHTVFVEYFINPRVGFAFVTDGAMLEVRRLPGQRSIDARVAALQEALRDRTTSPREVRQRAERLYVDLIGPIQDLIAGKDHVVVAPDGVLADVPFGALARPGDSPAADWVIREHAISYAPSLAVASRLAQRPEGTFDGSLLIGDPDLDRSALALAPLTERASDVAFDRLDEHFSALPGARAEVSAIARSVPRPRRILTGSRGSEDQLLASAKEPLEVLHIAAHGLADGATTNLQVTQPAILLARQAGSPRDGILTLEEIIAQEPRARLVTLSGCATGVGWRALGDNAFGLAGAFLFAGSEVVVASSWEVEDESARRLMTAFYRGLTDGSPEALRRAQLREANRSHPFYWASWRHYGFVRDASPKE